MPLNDRHACPALRSVRRRQRTAAGVLITGLVVAGLVVLSAAFAHQLLDATTAPATTAPSVASAEPSAPATDDVGAPGATPRAEGADRRPPRGETGETGSDSVTAFDDAATVTNLAPALRTALEQSAAGADQAGIDIVVTSGWRPADLQQQLLDEAVTRYGSLDEAQKWVATPQTSAHVSGDAVDLGPATATAWLSEHGATYGLCQIYANEPWHYELRPEAPASGCPPLYTDPTQDPRMQQ